MKKILAVLLALIMVLGVTSAFADEMKKPLKVGVTIYQFNDNFMTRWAMYGNTPLDDRVKAELYPALRAKIAGGGELEAANKLLNWVQTAFEYEYDEVVWGHDRAFFAEETLYYVSPITISRTTVVRAIAYRYDGVSDIAEKTFTKTTDDGIDAATVNGEDANLTRYNLAGQRVGKNYKGIVIENGHKVVRK